MAKDFVLVFDLGSSHIRALTACKGVNNTFVIKSQASFEYPGYYEGRFLDQEGLLSNFQKALSTLDFHAAKRAEKIYIGVPAEFSSVSNTTSSLNFGERHKIKKSDIDTLFYSASEKAKGENVEILSVCPISFKLDDGRVVSQPIGENANNVQAELSIVYVNKEYISIFNNLVSELGFSSVEYISEPLCEALFCSSNEDREDLCMFINVGDITTNVSFVKGEGIVNLASFSLGGGHITNDLAEAFEISLTEADRLKRQIVLSLKPNSKDFYELMSDGGNIVKIPMNLANEVASFRIETIASAITQCMQLFSKEFIPYLPAYLTGAGVAKIKGGRDFLAKCLGRNVKYGLPPLPGKDKSENASIYSLTSQALRSQNV